HPRGVSLHPAWLRNRNLQRPSYGDVLYHSGIESAGDKNQESCLREEDVPEFFSEIGSGTARRTGCRDSRCRQRQKPGPCGIIRRISRLHGGSSRDFGNTLVITKRSNNG